MSFFRGALMLAVTAGAVHFFRKDLRRVLLALSKPAGKFVSEVRQELEKPESDKAAGDGQIKSVAAPPPPIVDPSKVPSPPASQTPSAPAESAAANKEQPLR